ncbi:hypothetical protein VTL71DRAFT_2569 [Oculimacula yallundae]|uniref:Plasma membrane proteolipid 3 n=1 Tax=Oculimacula yallundae TaxID=86028 RepID=A0ABR4C980_9HELO
MAILERILIFTINIFCPPLSVLLVAGPGPDCLINILLFIAGVIPGHIHAFYVTCTYFHRKHKVKRGRDPGGMKAGIYSERVWNGGVSGRRVEELRVEERRRVEMKSLKGGKRGKGSERGDGGWEGSGDGVGESAGREKKWWRH